MLSQQIQEIKPKQLYKQLTAVDHDRLRLMRSFIDDILAEQIAMFPEQVDEQVDDQAQPGGEWLELKAIRGCGPYLYRRWREGGKMRSEYIGKVNS
jgi:hypothetical protein